MTSLIAVRRCNRETMAEFARDRESLDNFITSGELGMFIGNNVSNIINNRKIIAEQEKSGNPDLKKINRANEGVQTCINVIKSRLERLGAKQDEMSAVVDDLNKADYQSVTLTVLKVMARKNPGMHQKTYEKALQVIANKNNQKQH